MSDAAASPAAAPAPAAAAPAAAPAAAAPAPVAATPAAAPAPAAAAPAPATTLLTSPTPTDGASTTAATAATTQQAEGTTAKAEDASDGGKKPPEGAPETYEDFKAPEGVKLAGPVLEEFKTLAKGMNLTQAQAQQVADLAVKMQGEATAAQLDTVKAINTTWIEQTTADKEFGGDKLQENLAVAKKALATFGTPELTTLLNQTGLGNHPEILRAFYRAGKTLSEDTFVPAGGARNGEKTAAQVFYPNMQ